MTICLIAVLTALYFGPMFSANAFAGCWCYENWTEMPEIQNKLTVLEKSILNDCLQDGSISAKEAQLVFKTAPLFGITQQDKQQISIEACKWALAKNIQLAEDKAIPWQNRKEFILSAQKIKSTPNLKKVFNYDDVNFSLFNGDPKQYERIKQGGFYPCLKWVRDCWLYGYFKVKKRDIRQALDLWGYSLEEFKRILLCEFEIGRDEWRILLTTEKKQIVPPGYWIAFAKTTRTCPYHVQLSLGKFGFSTNARFDPDVSKANKCHRGKEYIAWGFPYLGNPIIRINGMRDSKISSGYSWDSQRGVIRLPEYRWGEKDRKLWLGIEIKIRPRKWREDKDEVVVTKVYPDSPAHKIGIKQGDILSRMGAYGLGASKKYIEKKLLEMQGIYGEMLRIGNIIESSEIFPQIKAISIHSYSRYSPRYSQIGVIRGRERIRIPAFVIARDVKDIPPGSF